jgi:ACS family tartrate transporter-like MFS transporter
MCHRSHAISSGGSDSRVRCDLEQVVVKAWWHVVPLLSLVLLLNYLDKVNIGFASLQMNEDLHLSNTVFGVAAGLFAIGYTLAAIPSTVLLQRFGARRWISLAMVVWGLCSAATALVSRSSELFLARVALGAAEAGFTPGVIYFLNSWFPSAYRGRALGSFLLILPLAIVIGGPLSSLLLSWNGFLGLAGWKWLFLGEGLPSAALAVLVFRFLADSPGTARWLTAAEKKTLMDELAEEATHIEGSQPSVSAWRTLATPRVLVLALGYHGIAMSGAGVLIFLPLVIRSMGFSVRITGVVAALPALGAAVSVPLWGRWADRVRRREWVVAMTCFTIAGGLWGTAALLPSPIAVLPLTLAFVGYFGATAPFWTLPSSFLTGAAAAAAIAAVNVAGNLGSFSGPALFGWLSDRTHSHTAGLIGLASVAALAGILLTAASARFRR